jgi:hypothetical protein
MKPNATNSAVAAVLRCCTDLQVRSSGSAYATVRESVEQAEVSPSARCLALMADRVAVTSASNPHSKTSGRLVAAHAERGTGPSYASGELWRPVGSIWAGSDSRITSCRHRIRGLAGPLQTSPLTSAAPPDERCLSCSLGCSTGLLRGWSGPRGRRLSRPPWKYFQRGRAMRVRRFLINGGPGG